MLWIDILTNSTQQVLEDSQKDISVLKVEQIQIRKVVLQNRVALDILRAAQEELVQYIYQVLYIYIQYEN